MYKGLLRYNWEIATMLHVQCHEPPLMPHQKWEKYDQPLQNWRSSLESAVVAQIHLTYRRARTCCQLHHQGWPVDPVVFRTSKKYGFSPQHVHQHLKSVFFPNTLGTKSVLLEYRHQFYAEDLP